MYRAIAMADKEILYREFNEALCVRVMVITGALGRFRHCTTPLRRHGGVRSRPVSSKANDPLLDI